MNTVIKGEAKIRILEPHFNDGIVTFAMSFSGSLILIVSLA